MIDHAKFIINNYSNKEFELLTERLDINCPIDSNKVWFDLYKLRVSYFPNTNELHIQNSLHCFYNARHGQLQDWVNYNDFNISDLQVVSTGLSEIIFERPTEDFKLSTRFEFGLNIKLDKYSPFEVIERYLSYVTTSTSPFYTCPPHKGKPSQRICFMSDYRLKLYDKSQQAGLTKKGLLRYEVVYTELRKVRKMLCLPILNVITLKDLNDLNNWDKLFNGMMAMYDAIKKIPLITDEFPIPDINRVYCYCNKTMADDIKRNMNPNTVDKMRAAAKHVYNQYDLSPKNYHQVVRQKLVNKYNLLTNVHQFQGL
ncbi:MAG: hypothetical protein JWP45_90 [Mucilaginibacter sp.]|nr:hypothetical protein [Mucilaginibacter sp.]